MTTKVDVDVTVNNVKWNDDGFYEGDFKYKQTKPHGIKIVDQSGNINGKAKGGGQPYLHDLEITLMWKTDKVKIQGSDYPVHLLQPNNKSIKLVQGFGDKPTGDAPQNGNVISVPGGNGDTSLVINDQNNDGEIYTYNLVAEIDIDGGQPLIDDPIIINQDPPRVFMAPAEPATSAYPGETGEAAMPAEPATPAIPPEPGNKP